MLGNTYKSSSFYYTFYYFYGSEISTECEHNLNCITLYCQVPVLLSTAALVVMVVTYPQMVYIKCHHFILGEIYIMWVEFWGIFLRCALPPTQPHIVYFILKYQKTNDSHYIIGQNYLFTVIYTKQEAEMYTVLTVEQKMPSGNVTSSAVFSDALVNTGILWAKIWNF